MQTREKGGWRYLVVYSMILLTGGSAGPALGLVDDTTGTDAQHPLSCSNAVGAWEGSAGVCPQSRAERL
jgi:hypothetical protein